ncbi:MAG: hypothetical protein H7249_09370 [Chitinophagaceae bacterium]|nr:hypothetical protein [Oligoflexus sp.]
MSPLSTILSLSALSLSLSTSVFAADDLHVRSASVEMMQCVVSYDHSEQLFYGEGLKFVGLQNAVSACEAWADAKGLNTSKCEAVSCEPAADLDASF